MLEFLRKYQKSIYIVVTAVVIVTFTFFGAARGAEAPERREVDYTLGKALDGKEMQASTINRMVRFLSTDCYDVGDRHLRSAVNIFNDGVVRNDLLKSGVAAMVVQAYLKELQVEFDTKYDNFRRYRPYAHPKAPFLSAEAVWGQFAPKLARDFEAFRQLEGDAPMDVFNVLVQLYLGQGEFPPAYLQQVLMYQAQQMEWAGRDPRLEGDLSLFYAHTPIDWFGHRFMQLMAQTIVNSAKYANILGFQVSNDEARASLIRNGMETLKRAGQPCDEKEVLAHLHHTLQSLNMSEKQAVSLWKRVLKMRRLFESAKAHTVVDPLLYRNFNDFSSEEASLQMYKMADGLEMTDFDRLMRFEMYMDAVGSGKWTRTGVPETFKRVAQIKQGHPDLVRKRYLLKVAHVTRNELTTNVGVKEMWAAQCSDVMWRQLCGEFGYLVPSAEHRMGALEALSPEQRNAVDEWTRKQIVAKHSEWIDMALAGAEEHEVQVDITSSGRVFGLIGFDAESILVRELDARDEIERICGNGDDFYRITVLDRDTKPSVFTFSQAEKWGILDEMVDKRLEIYYPSVRIANTKLFKNEKGAWKSVDEVREELGKMLFAPLLKELAAVGKENYSHRFHNHLVTLLSHLKKSGNEENFVAEPIAASEGELPLVQELDEQFKLIKSEERVSRKKRTNVVDDSVFRMKTGEWSDVAQIGAHGIGFYQVSSKAVDDSNLVEKMKEGRNLLAEDAVRGVMNEVIAEMVSKEAIHFHDIKGLLAGDDD